MVSKYGNNQNAFTKKEQVYHSFFFGGGGGGGGGRGYFSPEQVY